MMQDILIKKDSFYKAFMNGAKAVISIEKKLNEINVFPVKDADTGTNIRSLMESILQGSKLKPTLKETLESISLSALMGSKGNSGLIFSQFISGLSQDITKDYMDHQTLKEQIRKGYLYAYEAIDLPVEGTMITLMRQWYELLNEEHLETLSFKNYLMKVNHELQLALEETKSTLPILKKHNVVDAGALAFTTFVDGFMRCLTDHQDILEVYEVDSSSVFDDTGHDGIHDDDIAYRYCTEVLIKTSLNKESIKNLMHHHGDSIVIGQSSEYYKIHLHTNEPDKVIEYLSMFAEIQQTKVDDMKKQYMMNHQRKYDIAILTDSISDIDLNEVESLQIHMFPVSIDFGGIIYYDKVSINNHRMLDLISKQNTFPKSASPSVVSVKKQLETLKKFYKKIIVVTVSSQMSSTYNVFKNAIADMNTEDIKLLDSKQNSVSEGLIAHHAATLVSKGMDFNEIVKELENIIENTSILVHVQTLDHMVRSGRVSKGLGFIAKVLNLKPIVSINQSGEGIVWSKTLGKTRSFKKIVNEIKHIHQKDGIKSYAIAYVDNRKEAEKLKTELVKVLGFLPLYVTESSSVIAMNTGRNTVAIGYIKGDK